MFGCLVNTLHLDIHLRGVIGIEFQLPEGYKSMALTCDFYYLLSWTDRQVFTECLVWSGTRALAVPSVFYSRRCMSLPSISSFTWIKKFSYNIVFFEVKSEALISFCSLLPPPQYVLEYTEQFKYSRPSASTFYRTGLNVWRLYLSLCARLWRLVKHSGQERVLMGCHIQHGGAERAHVEPF